MKSILQDRKECYLCRRLADRSDYWGSLPDKGLHRHHIEFGTGNRRKSEEYGLWVYLCPGHHMYSPDAVHASRKTRELLCSIAQERFEKEYTHELWMREFGRNWLEEEEE